MVLHTPIRGGMTGMHVHGQAYGLIGLLLFKTTFWKCGQGKDSRNLRIVSADAGDCLHSWIDSLW